MDELTKDTPGCMLLQGRELPFFVQDCDDSFQKQIRGLPKKGRQAASGRAVPSCMSFRWALVQFCDTTM